MRFKLLLIGIIAAAFALVALTGCDESPADKAKDKVNKAAGKLEPYEVVNDLDFHNFDKSQELFDDPATIVWCTAAFDNNTIPPFTVPIAGKLTSSSTSFFNPEERINGSGDTEVVLPARSVDHMYHGNPPPYRYGFTPGGDYSSFENMQAFCTTKPLEFQTRSIAIKVDTSVNAASKEAEAALRDGDAAKAQDILKAAASE